MGNWPPLTYPTNLSQADAYCAQSPLPFVGEKKTISQQKSHFSSQQSASQSAKLAKLEKYITPTINKGIIKSPINLELFRAAKKKLKQKLAKPKTEAAPSLHPAGQVQNGPSKEAEADGTHSQKTPAQHNIKRINSQLYQRQVSGAWATNKVRIGPSQFAAKVQITDYPKMFFKYKFREQQQVDQKLTNLGYTGSADGASARDQGESAPSPLLNEEEKMSEHTTKDQRLQYQQQLENL